MADYIVRMTAQDNITATIDRLRQKLKETGQAGGALGAIVDKFDQIRNSGGALNRKLKETQALIARMNYEGLDGTEAYQAMIRQAGLYRDAVNDARSSVQAFASDTSSLDAGIKAVQGIASAASIATGAMSLFGIENENTSQAILKVQATLSILNGVQSMANVLNSRSVVILKLKSLATAGAAVTTSSFTAALTASSAAELLLTARQKISTACQWAWNVAKAVGLALLGNWGGLALVAAAGIAAGAAALSRETEEQKKSNEERRRALKIQEEIRDARTEDRKTVNESVGAQLAAYRALRTQWNSLSGDMSKNRFLKDNKGEFDKLGVSVDTLSKAEKFFNAQTQDVVRALTSRARAAAMYEMYVKALQEQYELNHTTSVKFEYRGPRYGTEWRRAHDSAQQDLYDRRKAANQRVLDLQKDFEDAARQAEDADAKIGRMGLRIEAAKSKTVNKAAEDKKKDWVEGSLSDLEDRLQRYRKNLKDGKYQASEVPAVNGEIKALEEKIRLKKTELGLQEPDPEPGSLKALENERDLLETKTRTEKLSWQELAAVKARIAGTDELIRKERERLGLESRAPEGSKAALDESVRRKREELELTVTGSPEFTALARQIQEMERRRHIIEIAVQNGISEDAARELADFDEKFRQTQESADRWSQVAGNAGQGFQSLGQAVGGASGEMLQFAGRAMQAASEIIPQIVKMIAAYKAESLAAGVSSAAGILFPGNLPAIASIVSTILGLFASLPKFASGGVVQGSSWHGDTLLARVNSGEMILTGQQQAKLFRMISGGSSGTPAVNLRIRGSDLVGVISNYNGRVSKFT